MEFTGKYLNVTKNWETNEYQITFTVNEPSAVNGISEIKECDKLSIKATKFRQKRSLDANAYAWVLMTKIAEKIGSSKDEVYEDLLQKHGPLYQDEDGYIVITVRDDVDMSKVDGHWRFYKGNGKFSSYFKIKGSSEYDTAEMSRFIDEVILEAKEQNIETLPPDEVERMKSLWQNN